MASRSDRESRCDTMLCKLLDRDDTAAPHGGGWWRDGGARLALLVVALAVGGSAGPGCAGQPVTGYHRARALQPGHVEIGGGIGLARRPGDGAIVAASDEGRSGEPRLAVPVATLQFNMGVMENLDAGVQAWPGGVRLIGKYGILDEDRLMLALLGSVGWWSTGTAGDSGDRFSAYSPLMASFKFSRVERTPFSSRKWLCAWTVSAAAAARNIFAARL